MQRPKGLLLLLLCPLFAAPALAAAPLYQMTLLGNGNTSDTNYYIDTRINNDGTVAGVRLDPVSSALRAYLWKDGVYTTVSYTHLRAHETRHDLVCRLLLEI